MTRKCTVEGVKEMYSQYAQSKWRQIEKMVSHVLDSSHIFDFSRELPDLDDDSGYADILAMGFCSTSRDL